jgi:hypothetical protein
MVERVRDTLGDVQRRVAAWLAETP